ncbi:MAG: vitamin K epoxide reductase family protein [Candidatus Andersenbacteria bacterium]|nr:vitamin K epoxide reductase family protein [Candidatus Andersenbacteria bacterium]MBI3250927.1 vitamin K epoxide reductase family protein [Candidatus Andersenbacteria bacterium]
MIARKYLLATVAFAGLLISGYLFITHVSALPLLCGDDGGCHIVQASRFASHFGIPTAAYGILFYAALGIATALEKKTWLKLITASGFIVSLYLTYLEAFVVEAWCQWCVASAVLATLAFFIVWLHPKQHDN